MNTQSKTRHAINASHASQEKEDHVKRVNVASDLHAMVNSNPKTSLSKVKTLKHKVDWISLLQGATLNALDYANRLKNSVKNHLHPMQ